VCVHACVCVCVCVCACAYVCVYVCMCVCVYIYIYKNTHTLFCDVKFLLQITIMITKFLVNKLTN